MTPAKRRPGRPRGSGPGPQLTAQLRVLLRPDELAQIQAAAHAAGLSLSAWARQRLTQ